MLDGPAIATLVFILALALAHRVFSSIARRSLRAEARALARELSPKPRGEQAP